MKKTVRLLVDVESPKVKGSLPLPGIADVSQKVVEVSSDALKQSASNAIDGIMMLLSEVNTETDTHVVSETKFRLVFDASGEVSIVSVVKASLSSGTGLEFVIKRKE